MPVVGHDDRRQVLKFIIIIIGRNAMRSLNLEMQSEVVVHQYRDQQTMKQSQRHYGAAWMPIPHPVEYCLVVLPATCSFFDSPTQGQ
jgi:hypothetical protein